MTDDERPARLANRTMWTFEDIAAAISDATACWRAVFENAASRMSATDLHSMGKLRDHLASVERLARDGRAGRYPGER